MVLKQVIKHDKDVVFYSSSSGDIHNDKSRMQPYSKTLILLQNKMSWIYVEEPDGSTTSLCLAGEGRQNIVRNSALSNSYLCQTVILIKQLSAQCQS